MSGGRAARACEVAAHALLCAATAAVLAPLAAILAVLIARGAPGISIEFLTEPPRDGMRAGGILPAIAGTAILVAGTLALALPLGVFAAVYLREIAGDSRLARAARLAILNLAGVPSIVHGLFGLAFFVIFCGFGASIAAGCATLAILILPVAITASEEALRAVPDSLREASFALGATRWQTVRRVVLPNALPGILTGAILGVGRAAGETAPILFTAAAFSLPHLPSSIWDQVMALPYHLFIMATQVPNVPPELPAATALVLLALVLLANAAAIALRARMRRRARW